jgi:hypothetical protein
MKRARLSIRVNPALVAAGFTSPLAWKLADKIFPVRKLPANLRVEFILGGKLGGPYGNLGWEPLTNWCWIKVRLPKKVKFPFRRLRVVLRSPLEFLLYVFAHEMCHYLDFCDRSTLGLSEKKAHALGAKAVQAFRCVRAKCLKCKWRNECPTTATFRRSSSTKPASCRRS